MRTDSSLLKFDMPAAVQKASRRMRALPIVGLLALSAAPAEALSDAAKQALHWMCDPKDPTTGTPTCNAEIEIQEAEQREHETPLQTARRHMIETCSATPVDAAQCNALTNFYRTLKTEHE